jgi:hypothetical protein
MLFAAYSFGRYAKKNYAAFVPLLCMAAFMLHPIGSQVWYYSLYWLIPPLAHLFAKRLFFRSLGATFTAHAIGSTLWLYAIPMPPEAWIMLIPIVAFERILFAAGISISYVVLNTVLDKLEAIVPSEIVHVNPAYVISKGMFSNMLKLRA